MIPGPTIVSPRVLRALAKPILSHVSGEFVDGYAEALTLQKKLFGTEGTPFLLSGSGTLGMEAAIANLMERGEKVLCVENGFFGEKWEEIVETHGGIVDVGDGGGGKVHHHLPFSGREPGGARIRPQNRLRSSPGYDARTRVAHYHAHHPGIRNHG